MKPLRIIYMGTPDFAVAPLKLLIDNGYTIVATVTAPDKPAGRGQKLQQSAVKQFAIQNNLTVLQPTNLKNEAFITKLRALDPNLIIVVAFRMLPKIVWSLPNLGTFNLHASLLPDYRGAAPINWAIINGETTTGVTTFFIDDKIDTGEIILQTPVDITSDDNAGTLHDKLMQSGSALVLKTVKHIRSGDVKTLKQDKSMTSKPAHKLFKENTKIDWNDSILAIHNKVRGLNPYPTAWCYLTNGENKVVAVKLYRTEMTIENHNLSAGRIIIKDNTIGVAVNQGFINLLELQLPGKRKMEAKSLLNGYVFDQNAKFH